MVLKHLKKINKMNAKVKSEVRENVAVIHSTLHSFIISNNTHPPNLQRFFHTELNGWYWVLKPLKGYLNHAQ